MPTIDTLGASSFGKCVFHPNSATHNDRNPPPVTTPSRPPIPIKNPPGRRVLNSVTKTGVHAPGDALRPRNRRIDSPLSSIRCAPLTNRSRIASASVSIDWLLTGDGTMHGGSGIDLNLLRTIRLQIAVARAAIIDADPVAKVLLLLIRDGRLYEAAADPDLQAFLDRIAPADPDTDLANELYNGHLWTEDSSAQLRNLLAAAVAHFEARKPLDKMAALARSTGATIQINVSPSQRNAARDYDEYLSQARSSSCWPHGRRKNGIARRWIIQTSSGTALVLNRPK